MISCVKKRLTLWMKCLGNEIFNCTSLYGCIIGSQLLAPWQAYLLYFVMDCNGVLQKSSQFTKFSTIFIIDLLVDIVSHCQSGALTQKFSVYHLISFFRFCHAWLYCFEVLVTQSTFSYAFVINHTVIFLCTRKFLTCPRNMPLYEVMYYDNVQEIKKVCIQLK